MMILLYACAMCLITAVSSQSFTVLSTKHRSWFSGKRYFNFMASDVDAILGRTNWDGEVFTIRNSRFDGPLKVIMWRTSAGGGAKGDAHGRREPNNQASISDWQTGDILSFATPGEVYEHAIGDEAFYYAWGSYCDKSEIERGFNGPNEVTRFEVYKVIPTSDGSLQAYIGYDVARSRILIAYRGSDNIQNWLDTNFDERPLALYPNAPGVSNALLHPGFYDAYKELEAAGMAEAIKYMFGKYQGSDVLATGHSLGAALCAIAALELKQSPMYSALDIGNVDVITFGMPRTFSPSLAALFNDVIHTSWRIVNRYDLVPTVPTKFMGYYHVGTEIWYNYRRWWWQMDALDFKVCNGSGEDKACFGTDFWADRLPMINQHLNYFKKDKTMCKTRRRMGESRLINE